MRAYNKAIRYFGWKLRNKKRNWKMAKRRRNSRRDAWVREYLKKHPPTYELFLAA